MNAADSRSRSVRLALALGAALIAIGALSWWMSDAPESSANVTMASAGQPIEPSAVELDPVAGESVDVRVVSPRPAEESAAVVAPESQATAELGRLHLTVRSSSSRMSVTSGSAKLAVRMLRNRKHRTTFDLSMSNGVIPGSLDAHGQVEFNRVPAGDWMLAIEVTGFDRAEQLVTIEHDALTQLEITLEPLVQAELAVVLRHPNGIPLFDAVEGPLLETVNALRPVFLAECPKIGADLPDGSRRLVHRAQFVRKENPDQWMHATFKKPVAGCACVLLGERVLDAVPFVAGQEVVVLRVDPEALRGMHASLLVRVQDAENLTGLMDVTVTIKDGFGGVRTLKTDAFGKTVATDLPATDVTIAVVDERYMRVERVVSLSPGLQAEAPTLLLERSTSIRGIVTWPAGEKPVKSITLRSGNPATIRRATVIPDPAGGRGTFGFSNLLPDEHLVGFSSGPPEPTLENVRSGAKRAWKVADTRPGNVENVVIDVPKDLLDLLGDQR